MSDQLPPSEEPANQQPAPYPPGPVPPEPAPAGSEAIPQPATPGQATAPPAPEQPVTPPVAGWPPAATQPFPPQAEQPAVPPAAAPTQPVAAPHRSGVGAAVVAAIIVAFVVGAFSGLAGGFLGARLALTSAGGGTLGSPQSVTVVPSKTPEPVVAAAAAAVPAVVNIDVTEGISSGGQNGLPSAHPSVPLSGNGSGVAFKRSPGGGTYIITNNHVVEGANSITVKSPSGKSWTGTVVGTDPDNDIAVVKIPGELPLIQLGSSKDLVVGQTAIAIGSPYGLEHSVTSGVISALGRSLSDVGTSAQTQPLVNTIQTDAAINPGNSGGALVDRLGHLIGINTAIYSQSGSGSGIGFAIPVDTALSVADQIISGGKVTHPFIGLVGSSITPLVAQQQKLPVQQGALVESIVKGAGAEQAGVKAGDIVTAVDGTPITSMTDLIAAIRKHAVGTKAQLTILRAGKTLNLACEVSDRPAGVGSTVPSAPSTPTTP
jgi:putative serine protease PepD